jgi:WD40 repeat protein
LQDLEGHLGAVYSVRVWDMATGALLQTLKGHSSWVRSIVFSPDGRLLASGSGDETVLLWDTATGALSRTLEGHSGWVYMVAFAPGGRMLASASKDTTVRLWDTATGALLRNFKGHSNWVRSVAFSLDGQLLASGSNDATVRLWDTATGSLQRTWRVDGEVTCVEFCQGGSHLSTNLGFLNIKSECDNYPNSLHVNMDIVATEPWIKLNGEKVLWLPNEDQPQCSAIYGRILAIGHASGRISFIWLRV